MPSSTLYEMLAQSLAQPSQPYKDMVAATGAVGKVGSNLIDYKKESLMRPALKQIMAVNEGDPLAKAAALQAYQEGKLSDLYKTQLEFGSPRNVYGSEYDQTGTAKGLRNLITGEPFKGALGYRDIVLPPSNVTINAGEAKDKAAREQLNIELKNTEALMKEMRILGEPIGPRLEAYNTLTAKSAAIKRALGIPTSIVNPPAPVNQGSPPPKDIANPAQVDPLPDGSNQSVYNALPVGARFNYNGKVYYKK